MSALSPAFSALFPTPIAACSAAPVETPAKMPSCWRSSRVRVTASAEPTEKGVVSNHQCG
jgi:hypothetical protein